MQDRPDNEKELLLRIAEGDEKAFALFYEHYYNILRPFVARNAPSDQSANEILQMTFLRVWLNRHKLEAIENVKFWMIRIASREYLTYVRDNLAKQFHSVDPENFPVGRKDDYNYTLKEIRALVAAAVSKLSPQRKQVFHLSRNENLSIREIADQLKLSPKTVKNTLTTALSEIRTYLRTNGYDLIVIGYLVFVIGPGQAAKL